MGPDRDDGPATTTGGWSRRAARGAHLAEATLVAFLAAYLVHLLLKSPGDESIFFDRIVYCGLLIGSGLLVGARAIMVSRERLAWAFIGLNLLSWGIGELYWALFLANDPSPPYPSPEDLFALLSYPLAAVGLALLVRDRIRRFRASVWLDGAIAALTLAGIWAAFVLPDVIATNTGDPLVDGVTLAYPLLDVVQLAFLCGVLLLIGLRFDSTWVLLGLGFAFIPLADGLYTYQWTHGTYVAGGVMDFFWTLGAVLVALAAWRTPRRAALPEATGWRAIAGPASLTVVAAVLLAFGYLEQISVAAVVLCAGAILLAAVRLAITYRENQRLLQQAQTDPLTELGNRSALMHDLAEELELAESAEPRVLVMLDLDGFKLYNDSFGHPAGDALLRRLASQLSDAVGDRGHAYRIGGDEFCVLLHDTEGAGEMVSRISAALSGRGEAFEVTSSYGSVELPSEARDPSSAMQIADTRMYEDKNSSRSSARNQAKAVLLKIIREREPELDAHVSAVADLAAAVARRLGLEGEELDVLSRAAELHDIGKLAVPDAVLSKPSRLDPDEWAFIADHTIVGERILEAAPALLPVAKLVRSSHERWDGAGYPDGLAGEETPLGSRIIFACDAYQAMTSMRPYAAAVPAEAAIEELQRCSGSQFDPSVVSALCAELEDRLAAGPALRQASASSPSSPPSRPRGSVVARAR